MYADRSTPSQQASPTREVLVLVFIRLVACVWLMVAFFLAVAEEGCTTASDLPAFLEARVVSFEVLDVPSYFLNQGYKALVACDKLGVV